MDTGTGSGGEAAVIVVIVVLFTRLHYCFKCPTKKSAGSNEGMLFPFLGDTDSDNIFYGLVYSKKPLFKSFFLFV